MKILFNHADSFEFEATRKAIKSAKELSDEDRKGQAKNVLVTFIAVEKVDEGKEDAVVDRAYSEIKDVSPVASDSAICN